MENECSDKIDNNKQLYENNFTFAKNNCYKPENNDYCTRVTTTLEDDTHFETCDVKLSDMLQNSDMYGGAMNYGNNEEVIEFEDCNLLETPEEELYRVQMQ